MALSFQFIFPFFFSAFAYLMYKDIKNGIYAVIFLLPTYLLRFTLFNIPTTVLEMMIYILFLLWLSKNGNKPDTSRSVGGFYKKEKLLSWGIVLLFVGVILSTVNSSDLRTSLGILKGWFVDPFLFFWVFASVIKDQRQLANVFWGLILSGLVVALIGGGYALSDSLTFDGRLGAFYESPNYLAMYLSPAFLFAVYFFVFQENAFLSFRTDVRNSSLAKKYNIACPSAVKEVFSVRGLFLRSSDFVQNDKKIQATILLVLITVIFLTKSYGAVLGIVVALFCFLLKRYQGKNTHFFSDNKKTLIFVSAIALVMFSSLSYQKYEQIVNSNERSSFHSRLMIWDASREMLKDNPIFGIGPGTFQEVYLDYQGRFSVPYLEWAVAEPHNIFLAFYLQSGIIGFIGFLLILFWFCKKARTSDIVFLFLIYFLIHGLVDTLYWKNDLAMIFWLAAGIGYLSSSKK
ncbi:MAG: O-antigen ligase family protein [Candidatus Pacebacteria bacterium]|nr:O-antigen ligase family protein [Candidatus Paceibacterota bacterium]